LKGIIFTSFVEFAEHQFGVEFVDEMFETVATSTSGAYTSVGTYSAEELLALIGFIQTRQDVDVAALTRAFGQYTFKVLVDHYSRLVSDFDDSFDCIYHVDQVIHKSVLKLYPDAELPNMNATLSDRGNQLMLEYRSSRPLMHVAHGLILGCVAHYGDSVDVHMNDLSNGTGTHAEFILTRHD